MESKILQIGIGLSNDNSSWIKKILSKEYVDINFILVSSYPVQNISFNELDIFMVDFETFDYNVLTNAQIPDSLPLIIIVKKENQINLEKAIELHPYDIWIKEVTLSERISQSTNKLIRQINEDEQLNQFVELIQHLPISVIITNDQGSIEYVNPKFEKTCGYSLVELKGKNPRILKSGIHDEYLYKNMWDTISQGNSWEGIIYNKNKDGEIYQERLTIFAYRNRLNKISHYIGFRIDDTDRKQAEVLKNIKELAGGIAHEFSQPLQVIRISLGMLETKLRGNDLFARINRMVDKIVDLVHNLKNITQLRQQDYLDTQILDIKASSKSNTEEEQIPKTGPID